MTVPTYRTPQGVTVPRCLRLTAVGTIETSPYGSAFTYGYLLRSISLHRLRRQQTTESMGLYKTRVVEGSPEKISSPRWPTRESLTRFSFFVSRALIMQPYRTPQGVTVPRCLRLTAAGTIETSPYGSAFTYGYLLRSISLHRLRRQQTTAQ